MLHDTKGWEARSGALSQEDERFPVIEKKGAFSNSAKQVRDALLRWASRRPDMKFQVKETQRRIEFCARARTSTRSRLPTPRLTTIQEGEVKRFCSELADVHGMTVSFQVVCCANAHPWFVAILPLKDQ